MPPDDLPEIPPPVVHEEVVNTTDDIQIPAVTSILPETQDPIFIELQREKKRNKRLRKLLTKNKNLSTVNHALDTTDAPVDPEAGPPLPAAPVLPAKRGDPVDDALNFFGGRKKL